MKKFILVMVFAFITALFIAFNYLLWDRESKITDIKNLEYTNASYSANISAQKREINTLEEEVAGLSDQINQLKNEKRQLNEEKNGLIADLNKKEEELRERISFINIIKQHVNIDIISQPVVKWVEALNHGDFEEAYALEYAGVSAKDRPISLDAYIESITGTIKKIEITDIKIDKLRGAGNGEIYLEVRLDVKLDEDAEDKSARFSEGENEIYIKIDYSNEKKEFVISAINI
jgi:cell division protein FtsB